ncbi:helix-turn-helix domain-containing protein [Nonomuraea sp. B10E15]|uniref:GlxA family transcriptional regulator n=1 Tax=Nonomuraea sp. B10E15 TaxID=3153560 RepID=UPI00325DEF96
MTRVAVLATEGVVGFELTIPCQVFGSAVDPQSGAPLYETLVCGRPMEMTATAAGKDAFRLVPPHDLDAVRSADTVIVPASQRATPSEPELDAIRDAHAAGARIVSICTGVYFLAWAGLLDGRRVCTHWAHASDLARRFPRILVEDRLYVDDGDIVTSAGISAGIDMCLHLLQRDHGAAVAASAARRMVLAPHRAGTQVQFVETPLPSDGNRLDDTMAWMRRHLAEPLTLKDIAAHVGVSTRSLTRHFRQQTATTPIQWLIRMRLAAAQELLEETRMGVHDIATATGFGNAASLRQHFTRALGTTPTAYRRSARPSPK